MEYTSSNETHLGDKTRMVLAMNFKTRGTSDRESIDETADQIQPYMGHDSKVVHAALHVGNQFTRVAVVETDRDRLSNVLVRLISTVFGACKLDPGRS